MTRPYVWTKPVIPPEVRILNRLADSGCSFDPDACWIWPGAHTGRRTANGGRYGAITVGSRRDGTRTARLTHVVMWENLHGPVPEGLELGHKCMTSLCCNPAHVSPVTHTENMMHVRPEETARRVKDMRANQKLRWLDV